MPRSGDVKLFDGSGPVQQFEGGPPILKIISPTNLQTVSVKADGTFLIAPKTNPGFEFPNGIGLYFERKEKIPKTKEIAMPDKGATHWWEHAFAANWGWPVKDAPMSINESTLGGPGFYRVRIRGLRYLHGVWEGIGGWTPWRYFCIGQNENCAAKFTETIPKATAMKLPKQEQRSGKLIKGGGFVPKKKDTSVQALSPLKTSGSMTGTKGVSTRKMTSSSVTAQKTKAKSGVVTVQTPKPNIVVINVHFMPTPKSGQKTHIYVYFKNTGSVKTSEGTEFTIKCISSPKCFLADKKVAFNKDIPPDHQYLWISETETLTAGFYKMEIITTSSSIRSVNKKLIELNVPGLVLKKPDSINLKDKSKKKSKIESVQPVPAGPGMKKDLKKTPSRTLGY